MSDSSEPGDAGAGRPVSMGWPGSVGRPVGSRAAVHGSVMPDHPWRRLTALVLSRATGPVNAGVPILELRLDGVAHEDIVATGS